MTNNKQFTFFWLIGRREVLSGIDASTALNDAGYGHGSLRSLDFFAEGDNHDYVWNKENRAWVKNK